MTVDKSRQKAEHASPKMDKILHHVVSSACKPKVFQIAFFKGSPSIPHNPPPQLAQKRQQYKGPRKTLRVDGIDLLIRTRY